jgi:hypothetical protein
MGDRVGVDYVGGVYRVLIDGVVRFRHWSNMSADLFADGARAALAAVGVNIVADTARALDEEQDEQPVPFEAGDRVRDWQGDVGTVVEVDGDYFSIRYDDHSLGDCGLVRFSREDLGGLKLTILPPAATTPPDPFEVGDRIEHEEGDRGTVEAVFRDHIDVRFDDPDIGLVIGCDPNRCRPLRSAPSVTPHPDRPETADGEVPEGWREDCFGDVFAPDGSIVFHEPGKRYWKPWPKNCINVFGTTGFNMGISERFVLRSEAIARLKELLAGGGE